MKDKNLHIIQEVVANTGRFILAASFIFSGFVKAVDPLGFQYKIQDYLAAFGMASWFPSFFPLLGGIVLSSVEFFIGISLFFGTRRTIASSLALMLMIFMTPLTLYLALFDPVSEKASPEVIKRETGLSKAAFKRAIGHLYKERKITLDGGKIRKSFV